MFSFSAATFQGNDYRHIGLAIAKGQLNKAMN